MPDSTKAMAGKLRRPEEKVLWHALRYVDASAAMRKLTDELCVYERAPGDAEGHFKLRCTHPRREVDGDKGLGIDCRKWSYESDQIEGEGYVTAKGGWASHRDRDEWCPGCIEIQRIVDERKIAKRERGAALRALSAVARGIQARKRREALEPF